MRERIREDIEDIERRGHRKGWRGKKGKEKCLSFPDYL